MAMTGGETSIHANSDSLDISITMTGLIKKQVSNQMRPGEVLIGLKSSGLHSNGFTVVRKVFGNRLRAEFVKPTAIYLDKILLLDKKIKIGGMMHITGGAFTKMKDVLKDADVIIDSPLKPQPIFYELFNRGVADKNMYRTFNCGTGFVLSVQPSDLDTTLKITGGKMIGHVAKGSGRVIVTSAFTGRRIIY